MDFNRKLTIKYSHIILIVIIVLLISACDESTQPDTTPPTVSIQSPITNNPVFEIVSIEVASSDNEGVERIDFYIDDSLHFQDYDVPYVYHWNTTGYDDQSEHLIKAISYDEAENFTETQPIILTVDNSGSYPEQINITSINYTQIEMTIIWEMSLADDFESYQVYNSYGENEEWTLIANKYEISDTVQILNDFDPTQPSWFWVKVNDIYGYSSLSDAIYILDDNPSIVEIQPIIFDNNLFHINWTQCEDDDFLIYELTESIEENMSEANIIFTVELRSDTSFTIHDVPENEITYYQLIVTDYWGLQSFSNIVAGSSFITFINTYGDNGFEIGNDSIELLDNSIVIVGETKSFNSGNSALWVSGVSPYGEELWSQLYIGYGMSAGYKLIEAIDGGLIILGTTRTVNPWLDKIYVLKIDIFGNEIWTDIYGGGRHHVGNSIRQAYSGGYIIAGTYDHYNWGDKALLLKLDVNGATEWQNTFDTQGSENWADSNSLYDVANAHGGGFIAVGQIDRDNEQEIIWLVKVDEDGNEIWNVDLLEGNRNIGYSIIPTQDNCYLIGAIANSQTTIIKIDEYGNILSNVGFNTGYQTEKVCSLKSTADDGYIFLSENTHERQLNLIKLSNDLNTSWMKQFGDDQTLTEKGGSVIQTLDTGYIISGATSRFGNSDYDMLLIKTDPTGNSPSYLE